MQEHTVTIGTTSHQLPEPFLVLATQNPIENEGTYPLPEAQLHRFLFKVLVKFPPAGIAGNRGTDGGNHPPKIEKVIIGKACLQRAHALHRFRLRMPSWIIFWIWLWQLMQTIRISGRASPRAAQALIRTARARAFMENRLNVSFEDVKCVALPVLRHRILLSFDAVSEGITEDAVIGQILTEKEQGLYA